MKLELISLDTRDEPGKFEFTIQMSQRQRTFHAEVVVDTLGEYRIQVTKLADGFWQTVHYNGDIGDEVRL